MRKKLKLEQEKAEYYFSKLCNIKLIINDYEENNNLNPYYLVNNIKKELDKLK